MNWKMQDADTIPVNGKLVIVIWSCNICSMDSSFCNNCSDSDIILSTFIFGNKFVIKLYYNYYHDFYYYCSTTPPFYFFGLSNRQI